MCIIYERDFDALSYAELPSRHSSSARQLLLGSNRQPTCDQVLPLRSTTRNSSPLASTTCPLPRPPSASVYKRSSSCG